MGWGGGSTIMTGIIHTAKRCVPEDIRKAFYLDMITLLEREDWDTQMECVGLDPLFDMVLKALYPEWDLENL